MLRADREHGLGAAKCRAPDVLRECAAALSHTALVQIEAAEAESRFDQPAVEILLHADATAPAPRQPICTASRCGPEQRQVAADVRLLEHQAQLHVGEDRAALPFAITDQMRRTAGCGSACLRPGLAIDGPECHANPHGTRYGCVDASCHAAQTCGEARGCACADTVVAGHRGDPDRAAIRA